MLFRINSTLLKNSGLLFYGSDLYLYRREEFERQFKFLKEQVVGSGAIGWIMGCPGTGKSATTLAFISSLGRSEWVITWLHLGRRFNPVCLQFDGTWKYSCDLSEMSAVPKILEENFGSRKHIVFVDGFVSSILAHTTVSTLCHTWVKRDRPNRRLVILCSMATGGQNTLDEDTVNNIKTHTVYSWCLAEFLRAVTFREIFEQVKCFLDAHIQSSHAPADRNEMVTSKFHFAGGSCRMMFSYSTSEVIVQLQNSVRGASNIVDYILGRVGDQSNQVVNRLFSRYLNEFSVPKTTIVSRYASVLLAEAVGPDLVRHISDAIRGEMNPSMEDWIFEMLFFAKLRRGGVLLSPGPGQGPGPSHTIEWAETNSILLLDLAKPPAVLAHSSIWMRPVKWNQGGYDAIFWSNNTVTFVQVARGKTREFKVEFFEQLLRAFTETLGLQIQHVDIYYVVPHSNVQSFRISEVSGHGLLEPYRTSDGTKWGNTAEHRRVRIVGMHELSER
jgi:hypothetical protein